MSKIILHPRYLIVYILTALLVLSILAFFVTFKGTAVKNKKEYPWMGSLTRSNINNFKNRFCGGFLIDEYHVITAAHCVNPINSSPLFFSVGSSELTEVKTFIEVENIIVHEKYSHRFLNDDIAILKLKTPYKLNYYPKLPTKQIINNLKKAFILGWGTLDRSKNVQPNLLKYMPIDIWNQSDCITSIASLLYDPIKMICGGILASYSNGKDGESPCYGDSGGPILTKTGKDFYIVGIVSWGIECYSNLTPQVFTNVYYHVDWIKNKLKNS